MSQGPSVAIACQGGGSHTAFSAGVLAQLLSADELAEHSVVAISGTSGGAICATLVWAALRDGDREDAGERLERFWDDNAAHDPIDRTLNVLTLLAGLAQTYDMVPAVSPYHLPVPTYGLDVLRDLLSRHLDFERFDVDDEGRFPMLLLGAVDAVSGQFRAFNSRRDRITAECLLASAAIPMLFPGVALDGGVYWDGLFSQNPPVRELLDVAPDELWVIQVNPTAREREPTTVLDIADRRNELSGNLSLHQELSFVEKIDELLESGLLESNGKYKQVVVRILEMPSDVARVRGPASKLNRDPRFLSGLIADGRRQADTFLTGYAFERAWKAGDVDAVTHAFADDALIVTRDGEGEHSIKDPADRYEFVRQYLCPSVHLDLVRKQVTSDRVAWSVRVRQGTGTISGVAEIAIGTDGVSELRLQFR